MSVKQGPLHKIGFIGYSATIVAMASTLKALCSFLPKSISRQIVNRPTLKAATTPKLIGVPVFFFCSSAGEYEQAKPLIERFAKLDIPTVIFFASISGYEFAQKKKNSKEHVLIAPFDNVWIWSTYFETMKPKLTIVVRYEFWPAFLTVASSFSCLTLIDFRSQKRSLMGKIWEKMALSYFLKIFCVDSASMGRLTADVAIPSDRSIIAHDTKYDRVLERSQINKELNVPLRQILRQKLYSDRKILVLGSAWPADVRLVIEGLRLLSAEDRNKLAIIIVPHDPHSCARQIWEYLNQSGFSTHLYSQVSDSLQSAQDQQIFVSKNELLLIDTVGQLAELYGAADFAFIGGGLDRRVHNILEPAAYNLQIAFGPKIDTQPEAVEFAKEKIARVCSTPTNIKNWLSDLLNGYSAPSSLAFLRNKAGGSDLMFEKLSELINE